MESVLNVGVGVGVEEFFVLQQAGLLYDLDVGLGPPQHEHFEQQELPHLRQWHGTNSNDQTCAHTCRYYDYGHVNVWQLIGAC